MIDKLTIIGRLGEGFSIDENGVISVTGGSSSTFIELTDTPASYGTPGQLIVVNETGDALEFATPNNYSLPTASADVLGGVKIGSGITITDGVISAETGGNGLIKITESDTIADYALNKIVASLEDGITVSLAMDGESNQYLEIGLEPASSTMLGAVKIGAGLSIDETGVLSADNVTGSTSFVQRSLEGVVYETTLMYWIAPATCTINAVSMALSSNPSATGSYCKVQVMKNGTLETNSIFTADTPMQITESTSATNGIYQASGTLDSGQTTLAAGDVIHFRVNQADTGSADLLVQMKVTFT